jgi:hypothetical protein
MGTEPGSVHVAAPADPPKGLAAPKRTFTVPAVLRRVPVQTPCWLAIVRLYQLLLAGVIVGCLVWNFCYNDFSGVGLSLDDLRTRD